MSDPAEFLATMHEFHVQSTRIMGVLDEELSRQDNPELDQLPPATVLALTMARRLLRMQDVVCRHLIEENSSILDQLEKRTEKHTPPT